jgi:hypothetical protein
MGIGIRHFWIDDGGALHRVGNQRYVTLFHEGGEPVPEFAGKMVPTLEVVYDTEGRKPTRIIRIRGYRFPFDATGRLAAEKQRRLYPWMALMEEAFEGVMPDAKAKKVRSIEHKIAANRIRREVFFDPTPEQVRGVAAALGIVKKTPPAGPGLRLLKGRRQ